MGRDDVRTLIYFTHSMKMAVQQHQSSSQQLKPGTLPSLFRLVYGSLQELLLLSAGLDPGGVGPDGPDGPSGGFM